VRLGRTARWILAAGLIGIALLGLWLNYNSEQQEQAELRSKLDEGQQQLIELRSQDVGEYEARKEELKTDLESAEQRAATYRSKFGEHTRSIEIEELLFEAAEEAGVSITKIASSLPKKETIRGIAYDLFALKVTAEAPDSEIVSLITFSDKVCEAFPSDSLGSVRIEVSDDGSALDLELNIYFLESTPEAAEGQQ
jgi:hypothetical protein